MFVILKNGLSAWKKTWKGEEFIFAPKGTCGEIVQRVGEIIIFEALNALFSTEAKNVEISSTIRF